MAGHFIEHLTLHNFTAFEDASIEFSPGVNVLIGENGTGKTHVMKVLYSACMSRTSSPTFAEKLVRVFLPDENRIGRLVHRRKGRGSANISVKRSDGRELNLTFTTQMERPAQCKIESMGAWYESPPEAVYIPVKEMLTHAPGFLSVFKKYELQFEEVYPDIIEKAQLPVLRGRPDAWRQSLLEQLRRIMDGTVVIEGEKFFHVSTDGKLEFTLLAEGLRKLGLLWLLIQNGSLTANSFLFWDEPEANLNPLMAETIIDILLELQRHGVQVVMATHDYSTMKWLAVKKQDSDRIRYFALSREDSAVRVHVTEDYYQVQPNPISSSFDKLFDETMKREASGSE